MKANQTLWSDDYLKAFAKEVISNTNLHYWYNDPKTGKLKINKQDFITEFLPALGITNIDFGMDKSGKSSSTLAFIRGNRCQEIDAETLLSVIQKIHNYIYFLVIF